MPVSIVQAGSGLASIATNGTVTALSLPSGVTLSTSVPARMLLASGFVIIVNSPNVPITVDANNVVRGLVPAAPTGAPVLSVGPANGLLTGTYSGVRYTYFIKDANGNLLAESDYSPGSNTVVITAKMLTVSNIGISAEASVTGRRLYRPIAGGAVLFPWLDINDNTTTSVTNDLSDASLSITAAPILGSPGQLLNIASFRQRLFGVVNTDLDTLRFTESGSIYQWSVSNGFVVGTKGADATGISGLLPRRDALGVGKLTELWQVTGSGAEDVNGIPDFTTVRLSRNVGVLSQESVAIFRDTAYFLWYDGVYAWDMNGIRCVSDGTNGRGQVRSWFVTDSYFNRSKFPSAFGIVDPVRLKYQLYLASAGSSTIDRWVEYDLPSGTWWGPHKTAAFSPTAVYLRDNGTGITIPPTVGATDGKVYDTQNTRTDGASSAIDYDVIGKRHHAGDPNVEKYWGQLTMLGKGEAVGNLTITATVGELSDANTNPQTRHATLLYDMRRTRHRIGRPGTGKHCQLELRNNVVGQIVSVNGYAFDDVHQVGLR